MDPVLLFGGAAALAAIFLKHRSSNAQRKSPRLCIASCKEIIEAASNASDTFGHAALDDGYLYAELKAAGIPFDTVAWDADGVDWSTYSTVIIRTTWDYSNSEAQCFRFLLWTERLAKLGVALYNHPRIVSFNASKLYLRDLAAAGIPVIPTVYVSPINGSSPSSGGSSPSFSLEEVLSKHKNANLQAIREKTGWQSFVLKPAVSAGSRDTMRYRDSEGPAAFEKAQRFLFDLVTVGYDTTKSSAVDTSTASGSAGAGHSLVSPIPEEDAAEALGVVKTPDHKGSSSHHHHHHHHSHGSEQTGEHGEHHHHHHHGPHHRHTGSSGSARSSASKISQEVLLHPAGLSAPGSATHSASYRDVLAAAAERQPSDASSGMSAKSGASIAEEAGEEAQRLADATSSAVKRARAASASPVTLSARVAPDLAPPRQATAADASGPCTMMVQPYLPSVEEGEVSVIVIDGKITHAVQKCPVKTDFRTQEEYGGVQRKISLTPAEEKHVYKVIETAKNVISSSQPPCSPVSPGQVHACGGSNPLPEDALLIARVDFLRYTSAAAAAVGHHTVSSSSAVAAPFGHISAHASPSNEIVVSGTPLSVEETPLLLIELEIIEPCIFLGVDAKGIAGAGAPKTANGPIAAGQSKAARALVEAIQKRLAARA